MINDFNLSNNKRLLSKNNNIRVRTTCKDFDLIDPQVSEEIMRDPLAYFKSKPERQLRALNGICNYFFKTGKAFMTQSTLAKYAGYKCRETANRVIGKFIKDGILTSNYRHKRSCQYRVSSFLLNPNIRSMLKSLMSAFLLFPIQLLMGFSEHVTHKESYYLFINNNYKIIYNYNAYSSNNIIKESNYERSVLNAGACAREGLDVVGVVVKKEKREVMEQEVSLIPLYIQRIESPVMTHQQKLQLSVYPEQVVKYALDVLRKKRDVTSPASFLLGICKNKGSQIKNSSECSCGDKKEKLINRAVPAKISQEERDRRREEYLESIRESQHRLHAKSDAEWRIMRGLPPKEYVSTPKQVTKPEEISYNHPTSYSSFKPALAVVDQVIQKHFKID